MSPERHPPGLTWQQHQQLMDDAKRRAQQLRSAAIEAAFTAMAAALRVALGAVARRIAKLHHKNQEQRPCPR